MQNFTLKFQVAAEKTTNNLRGLLFATPGRFSVKYFVILSSMNQGCNYSPADPTMRGLKGERGPLPLGKRNFSTRL